MPAKDHTHTFLTNIVISLYLPTEHNPNLLPLYLLPIVYNYHVSYPYSFFLSYIFTPRMIAIMYPLTSPTLQDVCPNHGIKRTYFESPYMVIALETSYPNIFLD
jgi:hypothetical protein